MIGPLVKQRYSKITTYVLVGVGTTTRMCKTYQILAKKLRLDLRFKEFYHLFHNTKNGILFLKDIAGKSFQKTSSIIYQLLEKELSR